MTFTETLTALRKGQCLIEADEALRQLAKACMETGKKGTLTLTLTLKPGDEESVTVLDDVSPKLPKPDTRGSNLFVDEDGNLSRNNPRQLEMLDDDDADKVSKMQ